MTPENDQKLCAKYPKIFVDRDKGPRESCMHWGLAVGDGWYNLIDAACSTIQNHIDSSIKYAKFQTKHNEIVTAVRAGDMTLFNKHYAKMEEKWRNQILEQMLQPDNNEESRLGYGHGIRPIEPICSQLVADQVKEKFGGLRFYHHGGDELCNGVIDMAQAMSFRICEECGSPGKVGGKAWIRTLCPTHIKKGEESTFHDPVEWKLVDPLEETDE